MDEFPGNSQIVRKPEPEREEKREEKVEKIISGKVSRRKKPFGSRFAETFFSGAGSVWNYILNDILIPAAKDTLTDMVTQGIERAVWGDRASSRGRSSRPSGNSGYVSYNRITQPSRRETPRTMSHRARATHDFEEILLDSRKDAESVLDRMFELAQKYDQVTISDLYDLVGIQGTFADERWGWRDLRGARAIRVDGGYLLDLPATIALD